MSIPAHHLDALPSSHFLQNRKRDSGLNQPTGPRVSQVVETEVFNPGPAAGCVPCPLIIDSHLSDSRRIGTVWPDTFFRMHEHPFIMLTNQPAPRVTTQGLEQDFGLQQGTLTPQTTEGKIFSEALPYLTPVGAERLAAQAPSIAGRVAQGASRLLAENAVGSLAANSERDNPEALATDLGTGVVLGGAINQLGRAAGAAYRGVRGTIAPEAQQAIQFANAADVPLHTTDVLQPNSRIGRMAQTTAENIPFAGTSSLRAGQQEARSQLVDEFASRFGEYDPSIVVGSLKAKTSGIKRAAGNRLEQVQNAMTGVNIQPSKAIQQIDTEIASLQKLGKVADNDTISKLQDYRDELTRNAGASGPMAMDLQQLSALRS